MCLVSEEFQPPIKLNHPEAERSKATSKELKEGEAEKEQTEAQRSKEQQKGVAAKTLQLTGTH